MLTRRTSVTSCTYFIQVTKPIISSRIIRFQVEQTNNIVALAVFMFILNISVEQTKFQYNGGSISNSYEVQTSLVRCKKDCLFW